MTVQDGQPTARDDPARWVLIAGMHRSGTSALAGAVAALGLTLPPAWDLLTGRPDNPEHFESTTLIDANAALLGALGGGWDDPPQLLPGWETEPPATDFDDRARAALSTVFPDPGPNVWKDPRNCLLLPYWRRLLPGSTAAVFVWRSPLEVARSLRARDGSSLAEGLALWEYYNHQALNGLQGLPVYCLTNQTLLADAGGTCRALAGWLEEVGVHPVGGGRWDTEAAAAVVDPRLPVNTTGTTDAEDLLTARHRALIDHLTELEGPHPALSSAAPEVSAWATTVLDLRHRISDTEGQLATLTRGTEEIRTAHQDLIKTYHDSLVLTDDRLQRILELQDEVTVLRRTIDEREGALATADHQLAAAEGALASARAESDELGRQVNDLADDLARTRASASWRMTAPLRSAKAALQGRPTEPKEG